MTFSLVIRKKGKWVYECKHIAKPQKCFRKMIWTELCKENGVLCVVCKNKPLCGGVSYPRLADQSVVPDHFLHWLSHSCLTGGSVDCPVKGKRERKIIYKGYFFLNCHEFMYHISCLCSCNQHYCCCAQQSKYNIF